MERHFIAPLLQMASLSLPAQVLSLQRELIPCHGTLVQMWPLGIILRSFVWMVYRRRTTSFTGARRASEPFCRPELRNT